MSQNWKNLTDQQLVELIATVNTGDFKVKFPESIEGGVLEIRHDLANVIWEIKPDGSIDQYTMGDE